ncbi:MAG TPA: TerC/Alx family metal homeostasis membrane protein, partial [Gemmatimonadaceae bacterium]
MMLLWGGFIALILTVLALDLGVFNRRPHAPTIPQALGFAGATAILALLFAAFLYQAYTNHWAGLGLIPDAVSHRANDGRLATVKFLAGYIVELSLSMDNVFVIALIFEHLRIPLEQQHRVLFWGVLGALVMRGAMIAGGAALVGRYHWVLYVMGAFLVYAAARMLLAKGKDRAPAESGLVRLLRRWFRVTDDLHGGRFRITRDGKLWFTPLLVALLLVESTDLVFAVDSIPAIFAITTDSFLVFTSNVFAILCLRSLYFGLAHLLAKFRYLKGSLALILGLVGVKMLAAEWLDSFLGDSVNFWMLGAVAAVLAVGAVASVYAE